MRVFITGFVLSGVLIVAMFLVPRFLIGADRANALQAQEQAELARRQYFGYVHSLAPLGNRADLENLKNADFERLVKQAQERFDKLQQRFALEAERLRGHDRRMQVDPGNARAVSVDAAGVRSAVAGFGRLFADNRALLTETIRIAQEANRVGAGALGVAQILGVLKLTDATDALAVVRHLRTRSEAAQARALGLAYEWAQSATEADHYRKLEPGEIVSSLGKDADELAAALLEATLRAESLTLAVAERQTELEHVRKELASGRERMDELEAASFPAGDDAAFAEYRRSLSELSARLVVSQEREQRLASGGLVDAKLSGDLLSDFRIEGGRPSDGLDELERKLEIAKGHVARYTRGAAAVQTQIAAVQAGGKSAMDLAQLAAAHADGLKQRLDGVVSELDALAKEIAQHEQSALDAGAAAVSAFGSASQAITAWTSAARDQQQTADVEKRNLRLTMIARQNAELLAGASQARAKLLVGQIQAERVAGATASKQTAEQLAATVPGLAPASAALDDVISVAREAAIKSLSEAAATFTNLSKRPGTEAWVFQAGLATVAYNLAQIDAINREQHLATASANIRNTMDRLKQSPYAAPLAAFHAKLAGPSPTSAPASDQPDDDQGLNP